MEIQDKVAVITGASAGIGAALARELAQAGARLVLTARRGAQLEELARELGGDVAILAADISEPDTAARLLDLALERFGRADILVNNAGLLDLTPIDEVELDAMSRIIRVNFDAVVRASYVFAKHFKPKKSGAIVNVSSLAAYVDGPLGAVYAGTKHAVEGFTSSLRVELAGTGVRLCSIAPGSTDTDMYDDLRERYSPVLQIPEMPIVKAEDVARAIRFMIEQPDNANIAKMIIVSSHQTV